VSSDLLRRAATVLRERADRVPEHFLVEVTADEPEAMHPGVGHALADLLDAFAENDWSEGAPSLEATRVLAVARAVLGDTP
jgi:hypothetical protein